MASAEYTRAIAPRMKSAIAAGRIRRVRRGAAVARSCIPEYNERCGPGLKKVPEEIAARASVDLRLWGREVVCRQRRPAADHPVLPSKPIRFMHERAVNVERI